MPFNGELPTRSRAYSEPEPKLKVLINVLGYKYIPFKAQKFIGHSPPLQIDQPAFRQKVMDD